ncbi:SPFH domain-containing protein [Arcanobacterium pinnipediorum]|uniref:SPFH domain-containing protein n=1 Tax=Arcanobacterium pinnipediorum TaxID=1503041 RepID=A0ABY5AI68_9ACTO|nr:SPFH domain-containing protein [Arcanobacterium pinnipediorum]USR79690.1 SPFH domain-containing protein [Arcanobacterium pinnipediorum]
MSTTPTVKVAADPVGHSGIRVDVTEKRAWCLPTGLAIVALFIVIAAIIVSSWFFIQGAIAQDSGSATTLTGIIMAGCAIVILVSVIMLSGFIVISPGESRVVQLFGTYKGTIRITGFGFTYPLSSRKKVSVRVRNFETNETKVNDYSGNPINIAAIVVWQVADTAKAQFSVENYVEFIKSQSESALRHIATQHPYDFPVDGRSSLRGSTEDISIELANEVAERVSVAGLEIVETRISSLSYAPEIAQAMLQRQQAAAIVDARETIVDGAVSMVEMALDQLEQKNIVDLDPERRAAMVSNLLVVLCSDGQTQPVINAGGLYQ